MSIISNLFEQQHELYEELDQQDFTTIEQALVEVLDTDDKLSVEDAVALLAESAQSDFESLLASLKDHWAITEGLQSPTNDQLDESVRRRARSAYSKGKRGYGKAKRGYGKAKSGYGKAKNSKAGKAVRRVAKSKGAGLLKRAAANFLGA